MKPNNQLTLAHLPTLRILVPMAVGIIVAHTCHAGWIVAAIVVVLAIAAASVVAGMGKDPMSQYRARTLYIIPIALASLAVGIAAYRLAQPPALDPVPPQGSTAVYRIDNIKRLDFSQALEATMLGYSEGTGKAFTRTPAHSVRLSTRGCNYLLQPGDLVATSADILPIENRGNPDEMDYASLMRGRGIAYTTHTPVRQLELVGHSDTWTTRMARFRHSLTAAVAGSQLSEPAKQLVIALIIGNDDFIDPQQRSTYSWAGIAHVLALSGLHVGIIAMILWWVLFPLDYLGMKKLRLIVTLAAIVAFDVFTGMSPSVIRATVMIGFTMAAVIFYRRSSGLNALIVAALLILLFRPMALMEVGFQLSFITVLALLLTARWTDQQRGGNRAVQYVKGMVITSAVAMVSTIVLTAHYFHSISILGIVANLLVLPVFPIIMVAAALMVLLAWGGIEVGALNALLDVLCGYVNGVAQFITSLPLSHVTGVYVSTVGTIAFYIVAVLLLLWWRKRQVRYLQLAAVATIAWCIHSVVSDLSTPRQGVMILNDYSGTPILSYAGSEARLWCPDGNINVQAFERIHSGLLAHRGITHVELITAPLPRVGYAPTAADSTRTVTSDRNPLLTVSSPLALTPAGSMLVAGGGQWKRVQQRDTTIHTPLLVISRQFHSDLAHLHHLYNFDRVVISGAHHDAATLEQQCLAHGIPCHNIAHHGYYPFP